MIAVDISAFVADISAHDVDDCVMYVVDHSHDLSFSYLHNHHKVSKKVNDAAKL